jgi:hypothetical protein
MSNENPARALAPLDQVKYILRLYVAGSTSRSSRAIANIKRVELVALLGRIMSIL